MSQPNPMRIWPPPLPQSPAGASSPPPANLREKIIAALRKVFDPEIPVNIYDLGLIYKIEINEAARRVAIEMTLTTPNCPEAESLPDHVRQQVELIPEVTEADVRIVWDPPWDRSKISEEAKLILGLE